MGAWPRAFRGALCLELTIQTIGGAVRWLRRQENILLYYGKWLPARQE